MRFPQMHFNVREKKRKSLKVHVKGLFAVVCPQRRRELQGTRALVLRCR